MYVCCVRQGSCSQSSLKQNITNVIVCEMFHFFYESYALKTSETFQ